MTAQNRTLLQQYIMARLQILNQLGFDRITGLGARRIQISLKISENWDVLRKINRLSYVLEALGGALELACANAAGGSAITRIKIVRAVFLSTKGLLLKD